MTISFNLISLLLFIEKLLYYYKKFNRRVGQLASQLWSRAIVANKLIDDKKETARGRETVSADGDSMTIKIEASSTENDQTSLITTCTLLEV